LREFGWKVLRRIYEVRKYKFTRAGREVHNIMVHNQCSSYQITGVMRAANMRLAEHAACKRDLKNQCDILVMETERKPTLCPYRGTWQDNIKIVLKELCFST